MSAGPTGWGSLMRKTQNAFLGDVEVNVNSRGGLEAILAFAAGRYGGWYSEEPRSVSKTARSFALEPSGTAERWRWHLRLSDNGLLRATREGPTDQIVIEFDLRQPHYRASTKALLEAERKRYAREQGWR